MSSTFPRCNSTCDIEEQTQQVFTNFLQTLPGPNTPEPSRGLKPEATRAAEPKGTECVKFLRLQLDWFSPPDANIPVNQTLNMPLITCLGNINC